MEQSDSASTATTYKKQFVDHQYQKQMTDVKLCDTSEGHQDHIYTKNVTTKPGLSSYFDHFAVAYSFKFWTVCKSYNCTLTKLTNFGTALCICL